MTKMVQYHVPIYASCHTLNKDINHFVYALFHWVPLFDEYRVATAF
jgi:hypothetical protein